MHKHKITKQNPQMTQTPPVPRLSIQQDLQQNDPLWGFEVPGRPDITAIKSRLIGIAGGRFQRNDFLTEEIPVEFSALLLHLGQLQSGDSARLQLLKPEVCPCTPSKLLNKGYERWIGFGLSADGIWRIHFWDSKANQIIERIEKRTHYYGICITNPALNVDVSTEERDVAE
jgi:hypothetical protein